MFSFSYASCRFAAAAAVGSAGAPALAFPSSSVLDSAAGRLDALRNRSTRPTLLFFLLVVKNREDKNCERRSRAERKRLDFYWCANTAGSRGSLEKKKKEDEAGAEAKTASMTVEAAAAAAAAADGCGGCGGVERSVEK